MEPQRKIFVAGHGGLVGSALLRNLAEQGYHNIVTRTRAELDLSDQQAVREFFNQEQPEFIFLAAAKVGGIQANNTFPAEFIHQNLIIQDNIIHHAWLSRVKRILFLGSSCIFPRECPQPMREEYLLTGPLEPTNRPYAVAKIAGIESCWAYNRQYGTQFLSVMPTNLYGPGDNYDLQNSHVLPALIRKMHEAKVRGDALMTAWGTGKPRREFLYSDDMAAACIYLMTLSNEELAPLFNEKSAPLVNIGCGSDLTIRELTEMVKEIVGFQGRIEWDSSKPDGTPRKLLDVSRLRSFGWQPKIDLSEGIKRAYQDFLQESA